MNAFAGKVVSVIHAIVTIALLIIFVYFFGLKSVSKYLSKAVIVSKQQETPSSIPPPGKYVLYVLCTTVQCHSVRMFSVRGLNIRYF